MELDLGTDTQAFRDEVREGLADGRPDGLEGLDHHLPQEPGA